MTQAEKQRDWNLQVVRMTDERADQFAALLGSPEAVERFKTVALHAVVNNSDLLQAEPLSIVEAIRDAAMLNLEPTGSLGEAAIIRYGTKAQLMPMWRGYLKLVRQAGEVAYVDSFVIYEHDEFDYWSDEQGPHWRHVPFINAALADSEAPNRGDIRALFAYARLKNGGTIPELMQVQEVELARRAGGNRRSSPWDGWYSEMARKTVIKRLCKRLPLSPQAERLLRYDADLDAEPPKAIAPTTAASKAMAAVAQRRASAEPEVVEPPVPEPEGPQEAPSEPESEPERCSGFDKEMGACKREVAHPGNHANDKQESWK